MKPGETWSCDDDDGDNFQWWTVRTRRGAVVHCEVDCGVPIEPGDLYASGRAVRDSGWESITMHGGCMEEAQRQAAADPDGRVEYQRVAQFAREDGLAFDPKTKTWKETTCD